MSVVDVPRAAGWRVFVDRGGTFTDVVALAPDGRRHVMKVPSRDDLDVDPAVQALRRLLGTEDVGPLVDSLHAGTTLATNALLERRGEPTCLAITKGFGDALVIGLQERPDLFALEVRRLPPLHAHVVEVDARMRSDGAVLTPLDEARVLADLEAARAAGARSLAIALVHGFAHPEHERAVARLGREAAFDSVAASHEIAPEIGLVARGETTVVDASLTPLLLRSVRGLRRDLGPHPILRFMRSSGGLAAESSFRARDAVFSGPAGGAVALARVAEAAGVAEAIGLDMGGTSTDVSRWSREDGIERVGERLVGGVRLRALTVDVVSVAAGGGSILRSDGRRLSVGPESAGAEPGPACHGRGGPGTITDANVVLGRVQPDWFPRCAGRSGREPLDAAASRDRLAELGATVGLSAEEAAAGFVRIANAAMAEAVRQVSVARGRDPRTHALLCFGGAGPQHACALAASLDVERVLLHPLGGVLSAWGIGLADLTRSAQAPVLAPLDEALAESLHAELRAHEARETGRILDDGASPAEVVVTWTLRVRPAGVEHALDVPVQGGFTAAAVRAEFQRRHRRLFGFEPLGERLEVEAVRVEVRAAGGDAREPLLEEARGEAPVVARAPTWIDERQGLRRVDVPVLRRSDLRAGHVVTGPALVMDDVTTIVVDPGWRAVVDPTGLMTLTADRAGPERNARAEVRCDPVGLEVYGSLFMSIAEQMGETLRRVSRSTNMKERLDYSCALFTADGTLVANAPHVPVHLGAMGATVRALLEARGRDGLRPGMALASNDPYHGGSHLPDVTVVTPVFVDGALELFVGNRGHHGDIGGARPGSMPPFSRTILEEGKLLHDLLLVDEGTFLEDDVEAVLSAQPHPVRDVRERLQDLRAQVAANALGEALVQRAVARHGLATIRAYMRGVQDDAAAATRELLARLPQGTHRFEDALDDGSRLVVAITILDGRARFDFTGTAAQHAGNLNAPRAITQACVLYVVRCLLGRPVPLNEGCLEPIEIVVPAGTILSPESPAAVVGGNVETSQRIADVLLGALEAVAASQGTMNNVTMGNRDFGYYETVGGGTGAGPGFPGCDAVHSHLTNTRMTDVEVLERRHPLLVREFSIRRGSGGAGRWRGGDGIRRSLEFLAPMSVSVLSERRVLAPFGMAGGASGARGINTLRRADGVTRDLGGKWEGEVERGDMLILETPGGGGWGAQER